MTVQVPVYDTANNNWVTVECEGVLWLLDNVPHGNVHVSDIVYDNNGKILSLKMGTAS